MKKYEFTGKSKLTERAFEVYNNSFTFWKEGESFFYSDNPNSEKAE